MRIVIYTQLRENYGAHDWDGKGQCPQGWKFKSGNEYVIPMTVERACELGAEGMALLVRKAGESKINKSDNYYQEWIIDWALLGAGELTSGEQLYADNQDYPDWCCYLAEVIAEKDLQTQKNG